MTRRYAVAGGVAFLVVILFFLFVLKPKFGSISGVRKEVEAEQQQTESLRLTIRQLEQARRDEPATRARLARFNKLLPTTPDLPSLIRQLQGAADASGMDLSSIAPGPPVGLQNATGVSTVQVNLQVSGGFFRLETFLARLEDLQRVLQVTAIAVAPVTDPLTNLTSLTSTITFEMYVVQANARVSGPAPSSARPSPGSTATTSPRPSPTATR